MHTHFNFEVPEKPDSTELQNSVIFSNAIHFIADTATVNTKKK